jgi:hypothetical protein
VGQLDVTIIPTNGYVAIKFLLAGLRRRMSGCGTETLAGFACISVSSRRRGSRRCVGALDQRFQGVERHDDVFSCISVSSGRRGWFVGALDQRFQGVERHDDVFLMTLPTKERLAGEFFI